MDTSTVNSVLSQIRQLQGQHFRPEQSQGAGSAAAPSAQFGELLKDAMQEVSSTQQQAAAVSSAFARGEANVELADVMLSLNKAQVSFKAMAEVRNRLVSSYQDIMNMPI